MVQVLHVEPGQAPAARGATPGPTVRPGPGLRPHQLHRTKYRSRLTTGTGALTVSLTDWAGPGTSRLLQERGPATGQNRGDSPGVSSQPRRWGR